MAKPEGADWKTYAKLLEQAIDKHRRQRADDRCIEDDDHLYAALGDGVKCDRRVGDKGAMLLNCARFIERRSQNGGWNTYAELEHLLSLAIVELEHCATLINDHGRPKRLLQKLQKEFHLS